MVGPGKGARTEQTLPYKILFENINLPDTLPAQVVTITQQLDSDLDWDTFVLTGFGFGSKKFEITSGMDHYRTRIDDTDVSGLYVDVDFSLNRLTGAATWIFSSVSPDSFDLDPLAGFLPKNATKPEGKGFVTCQIKALSTATTGTEIFATADIRFDTNDIIPTDPSATTVIDNTAPTTTTVAAPTVSMGTFAVTLTGIDTPIASPSFPSYRSIASYDVEMSDNGGAFTFYQTVAEAESGPTTFAFTGVVGHTYSFRARARDHAGNEQAGFSAASSTLVTGNNLTLRKNGANLEIFDNIASAVVLSQALTAPGDIAIGGSDGNDKVLLDYAVGGLFNLGGVLSFTGGAGNDTLIVKADANMTLTDALLTTDAGSRRSVPRCSGFGTVPAAICCPNGRSGNCTG